jgi:hypothetical protein
MCSMKIIRVSKHQSPQGDLLDFVIEVETGVGFLVESIHREGE